jgi:regulator of protease activity HflC (stomatin/prohibitin superfamily)
MIDSSVTASIFLGIIITILVIIAIISFLSILIVQEGHNVVITRYGKIKDYKEPGLHFIRPFIEECRKVKWSRSIQDPRNNSSTTLKDYINTFNIPIHLINHDVPEWEVTTKDNIKIRIDLRFSSIINDAEDAVSGQAPLDLWKYLEDTFLTELTDYVRDQKYDEFNLGKATIFKMNNHLIKEVNLKCAKYGIKIEEVTTQNISFSDHVAKKEEEKKLLTINNELAKTKLEQELELAKRRADNEIEIEKKLAEKNAEVIKKLRDAGMNSSDIVQFIATTKMSSSSPIFLSFGNTNHGGIPISLKKDQ